MKTENALFWVWLAQALGHGSRDFRTLIGLYENPYDLFHAEESELERLEGISQRTREALLSKSLHGASAIVDRCERLRIGILPYGDERYPVALRELSNPPAVLYYRGVLPQWNEDLCLGLVGTRRMSAYGLKTAYKISYELAAVGAVIVSGMAEGIDGVCAAAALAAKGKAVAVLGCGVDRVYPKHHTALRDAILQGGGVVISEYPPGTPPLSYHFPVRNRIISGISRGTVVVEAGLGSGSLLTAKDAILQGRDIFAIPANVGKEGSEGTNGLLRDGANLVLGAGDILASYRYVYESRLQLQRLESAAGESSPDLRELARLGVIELTDAAAPSTSASPYASVTMPKRREKRARDGGAEAEAPQKKEKATGRCRTAEETPAANETPQASRTAPKQTPEAVLASLDPVQLAILQAMPDDSTITADSLQSLGYPAGDVIAALTMLEILGLVQKLPGALYTKI